MQHGGNKPHTLAIDVLNGLYGNGEERINRLGNAYEYSRVNEYYNDKDLLSPRC